MTREELLDEGLTEEEVVEILRDCPSDAFDSYTDVELFESVEALGEAEDDNECRDEDEDDHSFGKFLIGAYGYSGEYAVCLKSERVVHLFR